MSRRPDAEVRSDTVHADARPDIERVSRRDFQEVWHDQNRDQVVIVNRDGTIWQWNPRTGTCPPLRVGHISDHTIQARYLPQADRVITSSPEGSTCVWEADTGRQILPSRAGGRYAAFAVSDDAKY